MTTSQLEVDLRRNLIIFTTLTHKLPKPPYLGHLLCRPDKRHVHIGLYRVVRRIPSPSPIPPTSILPRHRRLMLITIDPHRQTLPSLYHSRAVGVQNAHRTDGYIRRWGKEADTKTRKPRLAPPPPHPTAIY